MDNLKVHFVIPMLINPERFAAALIANDIKYSLFSCYDLIKDKDSRHSMHVPGFPVAQWGFKHSIMDSGLFTMMFGAGSGKNITVDDIYEWMLRICRFVEDNDIDASIVECDCQKLLGPEVAWRLRREMRDRLSGREIINVFHLEDGEDGFKRLVEFSDYIAISVPELRIAQPKRYRNTVCALSRLARRYKPDVKIHLLGCTEGKLLEKNSFCTSADSSSWMVGVRFGSIDKKHHISSIRPEKKAEAIEAISRVYEKLGYKSPECPKNSKAETCMAASYYNAMYCKESYTRACGSQD